MISIKQGLASIQTNKPNTHACILWLSVTIGAVISFFFICLPKAHTQTHTEKRTKLNLNYEHRETKQRHVFVSLLATVAWDQEACVKPWSPEIQHKYGDADTANSSCPECWQFSTSMCTVWQQVVSWRLKGIEVLIQKNDFDWVSIINVCCNNDIVFRFIWWNTVNLYSQDCSEMDMVCVTSNGTLLFRVNGGENVSANPPLSPTALNRCANDS